MACSWRKLLFLTALSAAPLLRRHLQVDKAASARVELDGPDCYFDKECHDKVNWDTVTTLKMGFFQRAEQLMAGAHERFAEAGVPEDRIDYILTKWVKSLDPTLPKDSGKAGVDKKDCFFDEACHGKVNWDSVGRVKEGFFARLKMLLKGMHQGMAGAGIPEDRIDYILFKWARSVTGDKAGEKLPEGKVDKKDCYFDEECHGKVDWKMIGDVKMGFFARLKLFKAGGKTQDVKPLMSHMHGIFARAGMPEDRIDYILVKWVKSVYPEALETPEKAKAVAAPTPAVTATVVV
mmetsp:Transcript_87180/g.260061  ORF Transcript_87180/g.260061 Transcript_87180/m.260061 type:complete len:292 (+) Transcript_87180:83-958(+)